MFAAAAAAASAASACAGTHSVNGSLANLGESLYAVIGFQPQPLKKILKPKTIYLLFKNVHLLDGTCPPHS